jgi:hypothetical protein
LTLNYLKLLWTAPISKQDKSVSSIKQVNQFFFMSTVVDSDSLQNTTPILYCAKVNDLNMTLKLNSIQKNKVHFFVNHALGDQTEI